MKKLIVSILIGMTLLTGCRGADQVLTLQGELYDVEQDYMIKFSELIDEIQQPDINFQKITQEDDPVSEYSYEDDSGRVTVSLDGSTSPDHQMISQITLQSQLELSGHPVVKILAPIIGEEQFLTWMDEQESQIKQTNEEKIIQEVLVLDRTYIYFEYWPGHENRLLEFTWVPKPRISEDFEAIAQQLENQDLIATSYIQGLGGQTLTLTNSEYYTLTKRRGNRNIEGERDLGQAASYKVMRNMDEPNNYSVQLYGYMQEKLSYTTKVETMPGLNDITELMNMDEESFFKITEKVNEELTRARELLNYNLQREYYSEGNIGAYHYIVMVPEGFDTYKFAVLIE